MQCLLNDSFHAGLLCYCYCGCKLRFSALHGITIGEHTRNNQYCRHEKYNQYKGGNFVSYKSKFTKIVPLVIYNFNFPVICFSRIYLERQLNIKSVTQVLLCISCDRIKNKMGVHTFLQFHLFVHYCIHVR